MTFQKIKSGIAPFDNLFQGLYLGRPTLLSGKRRSGTSTLALRFLSHVLKIGEKVLLFTETAPDHVTLAAHGLGTDIPEAIENGQLSIVPYDRHLPLLPFPEALDELRGLIADQHHSFVLFDPVMPWLAASADRLEERLNAFFGLLEETAPTSVLILRHPVSPLARRLAEAVAERCAICLGITRTGGMPPSLEVSKYMGAPPEKCPFTIQLAAEEQGDAPILPVQMEGMSFQELQKATQRLQVNLPPSLLSGSLPAAAQATGFPTPAAGQGKPRAADRRAPGGPALAPLPLAMPHASAPHASPLAAPHASPLAMPHAAPSALASAKPQAPAASQASPLAPLPSPFRSHEAKAPDAAPRPAAPSRPAAPTRPAAPSRPAVPAAPVVHHIRFADAEPAATRPRESASAPSPAPRPAEIPLQAPVPRPREPAPAPVPAPPPDAGSAQAAAPEHAIRFSDVIP